MNLNLHVAQHIADLTFLYELSWDSRPTQLPDQWSRYMLVKPLEWIKQWVLTQQDHKERLPETSKSQFWKGSGLKIQAPRLGMTYVRSSKKQKPLKLDYMAALKTLYWQHCHNSKTGKWSLTLRQAKHWPVSKIQFLVWSVHLNVMYKPSDRGICPFQVLSNVQFIQDGHPCDDCHQSKDCLRCFMR